MLKVKTLCAIYFKRNTQKYIEKILNNFAITNLKRRKKKMNKPENPQCYKCIYMNMPGMVVRKL